MTFWSIRIYTASTIISLLLFLHLWTHIWV